MVMNNRGGDVTGLRDRLRAIAAGRRTIARTGAGGRAGFQGRRVTAGPVMRNLGLETMTMPLGPEHSDSDVGRGRNAAELGMASLIMGAVLFLAAPMTMVLAVLVWRFACEPPNVVLLHAWLARAGVVIGLTVGLASIAFGAGGLRAAKHSHQPRGIAMAGLLLGLAASAAWVIASIGLLNTTESLLQIHGR